MKKARVRQWMTDTVVAAVPAGSLPCKHLIGICLAVAGLFSKKCRRRTSVTGLVLNVVALSVFVLMCLWCAAAIDGMIAC